MPAGLLQDIDAAAAAANAASAAGETGPMSACDLLRLGLERADSAKGAVLAIAGLLERHGQVPRTLTAL